MAFKSVFCMEFYLFFCNDNKVNYTEESLENAGNVIKETRDFKPKIYEKFNVFIGKLILSG